MEEFIKYLGMDISVFLAQDPFKGWHYERSVEDKLPKPGIGYTFRNNGLAINCDESEKITSVFLFATKYGGYSGNLDLLSYQKAKVRKDFGEAYRSGQAINDPILGKCGSWELFIHNSYAINITYEYNSERVEMVTLMALEVMPA